MTIFQNPSILAIVYFFLMPASFAAITPPAQLKNLQAKIDELERSLLTSKEINYSRGEELQKINQLFKLQSLEIQMNQSELTQMEEKFRNTEDQKMQLQAIVNKKKEALRANLSHLFAISYSNPVTELIDNEKTMKILHKDFVDQLIKKEKNEIVVLKNLEEKLSLLNDQTMEEKVRIQAHLDNLKEKQSILDLNRKNVHRKHDVDKKSLAVQINEFQNTKIKEHEVESMMSSLTQDSIPLEKKKEFNFLNKKGELFLPVSGAVIHEFGKKYDPNTNLYTFHKGIEIAAKASAQVRAVFSGKVVFTGKLGGYRKLLIIDHGKQFYSLTGNLGEVLKKDGDLVEEGAAIGTAAEDNTPIYFEIRQKHIAVNPLPWFKDLKLLARGI